MFLLDDSADIWQSIKCVHDDVMLNAHNMCSRQFYGMLDTFPAELLFTRSQGGKKSNIYLASPLVKNLFTSNDGDALRVRACMLCWTAITLCS